MKDAVDALAAAAALKQNLDFAARSRWRVRSIMDGGSAAIKALLGDAMDEEDIALQDLPWPNFLFSGLNRLAQKIGSYPKVRVDPPETDDEAPRKRAEKRGRVVSGYDETDRLELQLPQVGRWLPGYGFVVWIIGSRTSSDDIPYPKATLRDPYDCYPGEWGDDQQPVELATHRIIPIAKAKQLYPDFAGQLDNLPARAYTRVGGGVLLGQASSGWANQRGRGIAIVEYYDEDGTHVLLPSIEDRVDFIPNPLDSGPAFVVAKRFAFNQLIGQYDHSIGLGAAIAKINILSIMAMEDSVHTETNIFGDMEGKYRKGRFAINRLALGAKVDKPASNLPYQMFEIVNRIERQFRVVSGYSIQDDGQSPNSFATGEGLNELKEGATAEVREYHKALRWALQDVDAKRLEMDEKVSPKRRKPILPKRVGVPHAEKYTPNKDIKGDYLTRRSYGLMAGWDDSSVLVGGLQMIRAEVLDVETFQQNIDGIDEDLTQINERIQDRKVRDALIETLMIAAQSPDPSEKKAAVMAMIEMLPESELKTQLQKFFTPDDPQLSPEQQQFLGQGDPLSQAFANGQPDIASVISRLPRGAGGPGGVPAAAAGREA